MSQLWIIICSVVGGAFGSLLLVSGFLLIKKIIKKIYAKITTPKKLIADNALTTDKLNNLVHNVLGVPNPDEDLVSSHHNRKQTKQELKDFNLKTGNYKKRLFVKRNRHLYVDKHSENGINVTKSKSDISINANRTEI